MKPYTKEIEHVLNLAALNIHNAKAEKIKHYLGTKLHVKGLTSPEQKDICKKGFSFYCDDKNDTFLKFDAIFKESPSHEGKNQALIYLDIYYKHIPTKTQLQVLPTWVKYIDNWAHSDLLSKFLSRLLEHPESKEKTFEWLQKWNDSKNLWERRQSLVSLFYYAKTKKQHIDFDIVKQFIESNIAHKEYFVQKAVGWTLRESYNVYPEKTFLFIDQNIKRITPVAFTTSMEKMTESEKQLLKQKRKNNNLNK